MRIDAHVHLWDPAERTYAWLEDLPQINRPFGLDELAAELPGSDIDGALVVQALPTDEETDALIGLADDSRILGVVVWVDLASDAVEQRLDLLARHHVVRGVRAMAQEQPDRGWLTRTDVRRGVRAAGAAGFTCDLLVRPPQRQAAVELARATPEVTFVLDHGGKPDIAGGEWEAWTRDIRQFAKLPNVFCKISGLVTECEPGPTAAQRVRPYAEELLSAFGAERSMFGSDWPVSLLRMPHSEVVGQFEHVVAGCSSEERVAVWGGTAGRAYGLDAVRGQTPTSLGKR